MPDLWRDRLDETPTTHPPISTGKAWSLQTSRQPTGDRGNRYTPVINLAALSTSKNMATTRTWYARMREDIPEEAECKFCANPATLKACWELTTGGISKGYLCEDCHDEMEKQISNNKHERSTQSA
jgi:hypothetical protein